MKDNTNSSELAFINIFRDKISRYPSQRTERSVEDIFMDLFRDLNEFNASRSEAPRLKYHKTLYTDGIVSFNDEIFTVFEFKKNKIKFSENKQLLFNQEENVVYAQAIKYILCSNSRKFASELKFNKVLLFNGHQILKISIDQSNIDEIYEKLDWENQLNNFLNDQRNLSSFIQNIILTKFNTIKKYIEFSLIMDAENVLNESEIAQLYQELTASSEARISIIRMNLKAKYQEFENLFNNSLIKAESQDKPYLSNLVLRVFIEISVHINSGINCIIGESKDAVSFINSNGVFSIFYSEESEEGEMLERTIQIKPDYIKNLETLNSFFNKHIINNLDVLYEDYDNLISDQRVRKSIGLYFTKSDLSHLCYEFLTRIIPVEILKTCHFYDPAAGSGNLLKAQEDFLTVIGSDIKKMSQDIMRNRNISVPHQELDFLRSPNKTIVSELNSIVEAHGRNFIDNPLLIIMNPPYRGKNTWAEEALIGNKVGVSRDETYLNDEFINLIRSYKIRSNDLSSFFMMKTLTFYIFDGYYGYLATFSPTNWLHSGREEHSGFKKFIEDKAKFLGGFIINGKKFFDNLNSNLAIAFSVFQIDHEKDFAQKDFLYFDLYKEEKLVKRLFELRQFKHWEKNLVDDSPEKENNKVKYFELSDQIFNESKLINFSKQAQNGNVFFKDIFRAINSQTGDDKKVLLHLEQPFEKIDLNTLIPNLEIENNEIYIVATDKANKYDIAIKPKVKKTRGCVFSIPRSIEGPTIAWHYLWDYLSTYPTRFYNAVPITRKYAYTFISPSPILSVEDVKNSRSCKSFNFIQKNPTTLAYIKDWQNNIGDLRGLFFFFLGLTNSDITEKIKKNVLHKNNPIWCPSLNDTDLDNVRKSVQLSTAYAIYKYRKGFSTFNLSRNNENVINTINYFDTTSEWYKKSDISKYLLNLTPDLVPTVKLILSGKLPEKKILQLLSSVIKEISAYKEVV